MHVSSVDLLLSSSGSRGIDLLRKMFQMAPEVNIISLFTEKRADVAEQWIKAGPRELPPLLSEGDLDAIYGPSKVKDLAEGLGIAESDVVTLFNDALIAGTRLAAPDGEHVSDRAARRLDEALKSAISPE